MDNAEDYLKVNAIQVRHATELLEEFSSEIATMQGRCLDIGCGPGSVTKNVLLPKLPSATEIIGMDVSEEMINYARREYNDKRISFVHQDIESPNLPNKELELYDNAVSFYCLHWCQDIRRSFENIFKLLRPGGRGLLMFIARNRIFDAYLAVAKYPQFQSYMQDVGRYIPFFQNCHNSRATLRKILEDVGFEVLHCSKREMSFLYNDLQFLRAHIVAVNPFTKRISDNHLKKELVDVILQEIVKEEIPFPNTEGNQQDQYTIRDRYDVLITYIKKPREVY